MMPTIMRSWYSHLFMSLVSCHFPPHLLTFLFLEILRSAKLIDIYRSRHNITASTGLSDPAVATGISDLIYEMKATKETPVQSDALDDDLVNAWAANLGDDGLWGKNAPAVNRVRNFWPC